jgi:hypothetical protein
MKTFLILATVFAVGILARAADAAEKAPKPSVCLSYQLTASKVGTVAICYDSEKPALFSRFTEVVMPGKDGGSVKVLVGWR